MRETLLGLCIISFIAVLGCDGPTPAGASANSGSPPAQAANASQDATKPASEIECTIDVPWEPDPKPWKEIEPGIEAVDASLETRLPGKPGSANRLMLYRPKGQLKQYSLGCVFVAPAGAPVFAGNSLADGDRKEHLPYVRAGFAVVGFELDGEFPKGKSDVATMRSVYAKFKASRGGMVNGENALEYALARMPQIDPARIYVAGHSSAAIFALLFAEHEPRIKGCIAYAPLADLFGRNQSKRPAFETVFPGIAELSPSEHADLLKCPTFLFHAEDDSNIPIALTREFAEKLKTTNHDVTLKTVPSGDHYESMIKEGIPMGIKWLKSLPSERDAGK